MIPENQTQHNGKVELDGKTYQTVAYRLAAFRAKYPIDTGWGIETECLDSNEERVSFKATIKNPEGKAVATGHAQEKRNFSDINKTSAYENCETSAIGRALATAGFIGTEFASAEEVSMATQAQSGGEAGSQEAGQSAEPNEAQSPAQQPGPDKEEEQGQEAEPPDEQKAERWARENLEEWLDAPCPFEKAKNRTWRELAENKGDKIPMKGKATAPRAYLHAIESWASCSVWPRMKARIALEVGKNGNGTH